MKTYRVRGGGGLGLHVQETGNPEGKPILFIHGFSQCRLAWNKQLHSDLAKDFRLVAIDLRGHGLSEKPPDVYGEPGLWAADVQSVIATLGLDNPVIAAWSYGGIVVSDYVACYGENNIAGTCFVGAVSRLGEPLLQEEFLGGDFLALLPGFFSENVLESTAALEKFVRLCMKQEPSPEDLYFFMGSNAVVPPAVRRNLLTRSVNNDSMFQRMVKPMLLLWGQEDRVVLPTMCAHIEGLAQECDVSTYPGTGHAPFWEMPERFNRELRAFRDSV